MRVLLKLKVRQSIKKTNQTINQNFLTQDVKKT